MKLNKISLIIFSALFLVASLAGGLAARVPESLLKSKEKKEKAKHTYNKMKKELIKKDYKKDVFSLEIGFMKPEFTLEAGKSIYVAPLQNRVEGDRAAVVEPFLNLIRDKVVKTLIQTELFSSVSTEKPVPAEKPMPAEKPVSKKKSVPKEKSVPAEKSPPAEIRGADYTLEIYIQDIDADWGYWGEVADCVWGLDLYDKEHNAVASGFDRLHSDSFYRYANFLADDIPIQAVLFVCRNNPEFNEEILDLKKHGKLRMDVTGHFYD